MHRIRLLLLSMPLAPSLWKIGKGKAVLDRGNYRLAEREFRAHAAK